MPGPTHIRSFFLTRMIFLSDTFKVYLFTASLLRQCKNSNSFQNSFSSAVRPRKMWMSGLLFSLGKEVPDVMWWSRESWTLFLVAMAKVRKPHFKYRGHWLICVRKAQSCTKYCRARATKQIRMEINYNWNWSTEQWDSDIFCFW